MKRADRRWATRFGRFVSRYTVASLTRELGRAGHPIHERTVYEWLSGRTVPRLPTAQAIVTLSSGRVRIRDITEQRSVLREREEGTEPGRG